MPKNLNHDTYLHKLSCLCLKTKNPNKQTVYILLNIWKSQISFMALKKDKWQPREEAIIAV